MVTSEEILRRLTIGDPTTCQALMGTRPVPAVPDLDPRSLALVRLGGSIAAGSALPVLRQRVADALAQGFAFDEVVAALVALAPTMGVERIVAIAPDVAMALGYDVDAALERLDEMAPEPSAMQRPTAHR